MAAVANVHINPCVVFLDVHLKKISEMYFVYIPFCISHHARQPGASMAKYRSTFRKYEKYRKLCNQLQKSDHKVFEVAAAGSEAGASITTTTHHKDS